MDNFINVIKLITILFWDIAVFVGDLIRI